MQRRLRVTGILIFFSLCLFSLSLAEESITITTYYPSPYGSYRELRAKRLAIGDTYYDSAQFCWAPDTCTTTIDANADLIVEGRVGIGTASPGYKLDVAGQIRSSSGGFVFPDNTTQTTVAGKQMFTLSGTFRVPSGVTQVWVTLAGGGGGGGYGYQTEPGGGGGGGDAKIAEKVTGLTPGSDINVTVGDGGGVAGSYGGTAGSGLTSRFGAYVSAAGGGGGRGGPGGCCTGGAAGGPGGTRGADGGSFYIGPVDCNGVFGGAGGGSMFGTGGGMAAPCSVGFPGGGFGGGGGGSASLNGPGGAGAPGFVLVEW